MLRVKGFRLSSGAAYASLLLILICHAGGAQEDNSRSGSGMVASAADRRNPELTPGGLAALYCKEMTGDPSKTTVEVNGIRATVMYASETQINFIVPEQASSGTARVVASSASGRQSIAVAPLREVSPSLFTRAANGIGEVSALDAVRRTSGPFPTGPDTLITILGTGIRNAKEVAVSVGGRATPVTSFGPEGRSAGLDQVTIRIPPGFVGQGALPLELTADGRTSGKGVTLTLIPPK
jgi:uncharacterized protein (TIGR03437 family)